VGVATGGTTGGAAGAVAENANTVAGNANAGRGRRGRLIPPVAKKRPPRSATPGKLLREQRELSGWSRAEVAWALCLAERQLRALEADDYANLPGRAYILGYWRNYANLLGVSIDHAIDAHKSGLPPRGARIALRAESRQAHGVLEQARQRWALAFGAAAVVFLAALWVWQGADDGLSLALPSLSPGADWRKWPGAVEESPPAAPAWNGAVDAAGGAGPGVADASVLPEPNFPESAATEDSTVQLAVESAADSPVDSPANSSGNAAAAQSTAAQITVAAVAADAPAATNTTAAAATVPAPAIDKTPPEQIILAVREQSWIEVHDGDGRRLIYRSVARGARVTLRGALPFSVFIGNPAGVSVEYRGQPVAFTAGRDGLFARFSIGAP